jgi:adenylate cyclase
MGKALIEIPKKVFFALVRVGRRPEDDEDERVRKAVLAILSFFLVSGIPKQALLSHNRGQDALALMLMTWAVAVVIGFIHFATTGQRRALQSIQLVMIVALATIIHIYNGSFEASYGMILWGALMPLGALLLCTRKEALIWLVVYMASVLAALFYTNQAVDPIEVTRSTERFLAIMGTVLGVSVGPFLLVWYFVSEMDKARAALRLKHAELEVEQEKSERLLLNILPEPIAARLKEDDETIADDFTEVTVLFADIVGFTSLSARTAPDQLVVMLNRVFSAFDEIAKARGVEKIKTIGDAYMAAAGLPEPQADHAGAMASMALDMREALASLNTELGTELDIRIGLATGPVVAGVIGKHKFIYDLWGDTVNVASRMESHGVPGQIQVSETVHEKLGDAWRFEDRGEIQIKGKGVMNSFFLLGPA